jgi:hypothetical protein
MCACKIGMLVITFSYGDHSRELTMIRILHIKVCCHSSIWVSILHPKAYILVHQDHKVPRTEAHELLVPSDHKVPGSNAQSLVPSHDSTLQVSKVACVLRHT